MDRESNFSGTASYFLPPPQAEGREEIAEKGKVFPWLVRDCRSGVPSE
jgi:hypothetical protein